MTEDYTLVDGMVRLKAVITALEKKIKIIYIYIYNIIAFFDVRPRRHKVDE